MTRREKTHAISDFKVIGDGAGAGEFEAIVSVFGNVDYVNDRVMLGAFKDSIVEWESSGDPLPVIWSHQWDDPDAHIGEIFEMEELAPGSPKLPDSLKALGGLWVKGKLDIEEDVRARKIYRLLKRRRVKEWSFAYDTLDERPGQDGANELWKLSIIEVGPTLKGANPATETLGVKAQRAAKAYVTLEGSYEQLIEQLRLAVRPIMQAHIVAQGGQDPWASLEASYADHVIVTSDAWYEGRGYIVEHWMLAYTISDGAISFGPPSEVAITGTIQAKSRRVLATLDEPVSPAPVKSEDPDGGKDEEPSPTLSPLSIRIAAELDELETVLEQSA